MRSAPAGSSFSISEIARAIARGSPAITRWARGRPGITYFLAGRFFRARGAPPPRVWAQGCPRSLMPRTRRAGALACWHGRRRSLRQELPGDDETLDLARPLADGGELHVAEIFLGWIIFNKAVATVHLHAVV